MVDMLKSFLFSQVSEKEDTELENICEAIYYRKQFKKNISNTQNASQIKTKMKIKKQKGGGQGNKIKPTLQKLANTYPQTYLGINKK